MCSSRRSTSYIYLIIWCTIYAQVAYIIYIHITYMIQTYTLHISNIHTRRNHHTYSSRRSTSYIYTTLIYQHVTHIVHVMICDVYVYLIHALCMYISLMGRVCIDMIYICTRHTHHTYIHLTTVIHTHVTYIIQICSFRRSTSYIYDVYIYDTHARQGPGARPMSVPKNVFSCIHVDKHTSGTACSTHVSSHKKRVLTCTHHTHIRQGQGVRPMSAVAKERILERDSHPHTHASHRSKFLESQLATKVTK